MKVIGIIAEFNPFHNGHALLIKKARELSGADFAIVLMSGDFVQRGTPAVFDKYIRTEMALSGDAGESADLVLELPAAAATGSAGRFAEGAVSVMNSLGCIDELWFGSESGNIAAFQSAAEILASEPDDFKKSLHFFLNNGFSFPAAREKALEKTLEAREKDLARGHSAENIISAPNNILGLEYCIALKKTESRIQPRTIKRDGAAYDESLYDKKSSMNSALAIRHALLKGKKPEEIKESIPQKTYEILRREYSNGIVPLSEDDFSAPLRYQLLKESPDSLASYLDISRDLSERIMNNINDFRGYSQFAGILKARNFTRTQINRALVHILLGIKEADFEKILKPGTVRMLGFRRESEKLLKEIKINGSVSLESGYRSDGNDMYRADLFASNLYEAASGTKSGRKYRHELTRKLITM